MQGAPALPGVRTSREACLAVPMLRRAAVVARHGLVSGGYELLDRIGTTSRIHGHDVHIRFSDRLYGDVLAFQGTTGLAINGCVRLLVERGLAAGVGGPAGQFGQDLLRELRSLNQSSLANLIATEQTQLLFAHFVPRGPELVGTYGEVAATNARMRLLSVEHAVAEEAGC